MLLNCGVEEDSWKSFGLQRDQISQSLRKFVLNIHWKDWGYSWNFNTLATWWEELTHWKRPWCWERLKAGGKGDDRGRDGWMASPTWWTWVWVNSGSWWRTGRPSVHGVTKSQTRLNEWTELNWTEYLPLGDTQEKKQVSLFWILSTLHFKKRQSNQSHITSPQRNNDSTAFIKLDLTNNIQM